MYITVATLRSAPLLAAVGTISRKAADKEMQSAVMPAGERAPSGREHQ